MNMTVLECGWQAVRKAFPKARPAAGFILGSGWRSVAADLQVHGRLPYNCIPGLGRTTVAGHEGELLWGNLAGLELLVFLGRRHWYEGDGWEPVALPIYIFSKLQAASVLLTNAAGGIRQDLKPGSLMLIEDHINAIGANPLIGPHHECWGPRFPDQTHVYDPNLKRAIIRAARTIKMPLKRGIYLAVAGPVYETPAEVRCFHSWGAAAVGMSTVPEAQLAHAAGLRVAALSFIANYAAGSSPARRKARLTHSGVTDTTNAAAPQLRRLLQAVAAELKAEQNSRKPGPEMSS